MSIEKITYRAATCNMGEATEQDGDNYRTWAENAIRAKYPDSKIEVLDVDSKTTVDADEYDEEISALEFCASLWDSCPWTGEFFD